MSKPYCYVFYANQLVFTFYNRDELNTVRRSMAVGNAEFYNGAYMYSCLPLDRDEPWFRMDGIPILASDVPKELHVLVLLMT